MANLQSTVPGSFNALYNLLVTAGNAQTPAVPVFHSEVLQGQFTQNGYVLLDRVENHHYEWGALGSFAFYETYDICGEVVFYQGGGAATDLVEAVLNQTWTTYQNVVMATVVENSGSIASGGGPVLGSAAPAALEQIIPADANYTGQPAEMDGAASGFIGTVAFTYSLKARITTA